MDVTYAVEVYFDKSLESKLKNIREKLVSEMNLRTPHQKSLTMTEPEIHERPCMTLFTVASPSCCLDHELAHKICVTLRDFVADNTWARLIGALPVSLDLEADIELGDENHVFVCPMDTLGYVKRLRDELCMEIKSKGIEVIKGNYYETLWVPVVHVFKQTWEQYNELIRLHEDKSWKAFCKENDGVLDGYVDRIAVVQASPERLVWKKIELLGSGPQYEDRHHEDDSHEDFMSKFDKSMSLY